MPTVSLAAMCDIADPSSVNIEKMAMERSLKDHKKVTHADDWQTCRIECGCGCHRHLDSLPHLLSPHIMSQMTDLPETYAIEIIEGYAYSDYFYVPAVQLPPPDLS